MLGSAARMKETKNLKGREMPKTRGTRRPMERTQKAKKVRTDVPLLETRARSILSAMVSEVAAEPNEAPNDLQLPQAPAPILVGETPDMVAQSLDDLPASALAKIARNGASLEVDGARHEAEDLVSLAKNVTDDAHLKINNSGTFTVEELAAIARSAPGQVILA